MPIRTSAADSLAKAAYAGLFVVVLPLLLLLWAVRLDRLIGLPAYEWKLGGVVTAIVGLGLMFAAMAALRVFGDGLPMSPFPPTRFVSRWAYRYLGNPIYVGAVLTAVALSLAFRSAAGLWIVSPILAAAAAAWVIGFERDAVRAHFGTAVRSPVLRTPPDSSDAPTSWDLVSAYVLLFAPWLVLYQGVELLGTPPDAIVAWSAWDGALPVFRWTEPLYLFAYPFTLAVPFIAATRGDMRWFMRRGWLAIAMIIPLYLLLPIVAPAKPVVGDGVLETLMRWERAFDRPVTAFPAFHVVWMFLAAVVYSRRWPSLAWLWWLLAVAVSASCITVGMHAAVDVAAGLVASAAIIRADRIWERIRSRTELLANGWREVNVGPVRLLNHGAYPAVGAWAGVLLAVALAGRESLGVMVGIAAASVVGAGIWAQIVEGSPRLLRPFGYFGSVVGMLVACGIAAALGWNFWTVAGAFAVGASIAQAIGRGRCLVQGCCHGREAPAWRGIRFRHPCSRVTRHSSLGDTPLHPTQLYSAVWMLVVTAVLLRLWAVSANMELIVGFYLLLTGLGRFVEEHFRGEPQTIVRGGLRLYQWLAIVFVVGGAAITTLGTTPPPLGAVPSVVDILAVTAFALAVYAAYGVDFPAVNRRFSRLT